MCPSHVIPLLGVLPDAVVAEKASVTVTQVATWRRERGINLMSVPRDLTKEETLLVGTLPDSHLAAQLGVPLSRVRAARLKLGLPPFLGRRGRPKKEIPPEAIPLLGVETDILVAERFGVSPMTVGIWRRKQGIRKRQGCPRKEIPEDLIPLLGIETDIALAKKAGVSFALVRRWRESLDVPPHRRGRKQGDKSPEARKKWLDSRYPGMLEMLGVESDTVVGDRYGLSRERIRQFRGWIGLESNTERRQQVDKDTFASLAGTMPDRTVALMFGVSQERVARVREQMGLPPALKGDPDKRAALESIRDDLGKVSDHKLAARVGIAAQAVQIFRNKLGIPPAVLSPKCKGFEKINREAVRQLVLEGKSNVEIGHLLGRSPAVIGMIRNKELHLPMRTPNIGPERTARILALVAEGVSDSAIADAMHISRETVGKTMRRKGVNRSSTAPIYDRDQMRALYEAGHTDQEVANIVGCHERVAASIRASEFHIYKERAKIDRGKVAQMFHEGYTDLEMCEELGCSLPYLQVLRRKLGLHRQ